MILLGGQSNLEIFRRGYYGANEALKDSKFYLPSEAEH